MNGGPHRRPGGESVIDQQDEASGDDQWCPSFPIERFTAVEFDHLPCNDRLDRRLIEADRLSQIRVENADSTGSKGAKGEFFVARDTELSDRKKIEWEMEGPGNLEGDRDAPSRKGNDECLGIVRVLAQKVSEDRSRLSSILISVIPLYWDLSRHEALQSSAFRFRKQPGNGGAPLPLPNPFDRRTPEERSRINANHGCHSHELPSAPLTTPRGIGKMGTVRIEYEFACSM